MLIVSVVVDCFRYVFATVFFLPAVTYAPTQDNEQETATQHQEDDCEQTGRGGVRACVLQVERRKCVLDDCRWGFGAAFVRRPCELAEWTWLAHYTTRNLVL